MNFFDLGKAIAENDCPNEELDNDWYSYKVELHCLFVSYEYNWNTKEVRNILFTDE